MLAQAIWAKNPTGSDRASKKNRGDEEMKCTRCEKDIDDLPAVYMVAGLKGYYCLECARRLCDILGVKKERIINLPHYIG